MLRPRFTLLLAALLSSAATALSQTITFEGTIDSNFSVAANWQGGTEPLNDGTETLTYASGNSPALNLDIEAHLLGIELSSGAVAVIGGPNQVDIGAGSIQMTESGGTFSSLTINSTVNITQDQTWTFGSPAGAITINGLVQGSFSIDLQGVSSGTTFTFNSGASVFGPGNTQPGVLFTGEGSTLVVGASSTGPGDAPTSGPLGIGVLQLGDGVNFQTSVPTVSLANTLIIGDISSGDPVVFGGLGTETNPPATNLTFTGTATLEDTTTEVDLQANTTVTFGGPIVGSIPGTVFNFRNVGAGNSLVILQGGITNVTESNLYGTISLIFDGASSAQVAGFSSGIFTPEGGGSYVGMGAGYSQAGDVANFITALSPTSAFAGTLGFDTTSGAAVTFNDPVDISGFTSFNFTGLGSATKAILGPSATINPPGATPAQQTTYPFGGGGGTLTVDAPLGDDTANSVQRNLNLQAGNAPLTLVLSGALTYTGGTSVDGAALIYNTAPAPSGLIEVAMGNTQTGYVGATSVAAPDAGVQAFIGDIFVNEVSTNYVIGFDDVSGGVRTIGAGGPMTIDFSNELNAFLGTATQVDFDANVTIIPWNSEYRFAGVKGGIVYVEAPLTGANSLVVGLPHPGPLESFNVADGFVTISSVQIGGASNNFTGGTTLNSGYLYVSTDSALGSGVLDIPDPTDGRIGWVASLATAINPVNLPNDITLPTNGISLNFESTNLLTLSGHVMDDSGDHGQLGVYGPVEMAGDNSYSGGTTLGQNGYLYVTNGNSLGTGPLNVFPSSEAPPVLEAATSTVVVPNAIELNGGATLQLNHIGATNSLLIEGPVEDSGTGSGSLLIEGYVTFNGANTYSGGTTLDDALVLVNGAQNLGTGPVTVSGSTIDAYSTFTLPNAIVASAPFSLVGTGFEFSLSGSISGSGTVTINSPIEFSGNNSAYSGTILFNTGGLLVASNNNALGSGTVIVASQGTLGVNTGITVTNAITLQSGGMLAGYGTFAPSSPETFNFSSGSLLSGGGGTSGMFSSGVPKPIPGTLAFGANAGLTFGSGGLLQFALDGSGGTAGTDYSAISSSGSLLLTSSAGNLFTIQLIAIDPATKQQGTPTFNSSISQSWTLITATAGISGFDPAGFTVDSTTFGVGAFPSAGFSVSQSGDVLTLDFTPVPEPSTWAMMASGVLALGAAVRRRSRR